MSATEAALACFTSVEAAVVSRPLHASSSSYAVTAAAFKFLSRSAMLERDSAVGGVSVRLSVTRRFSTKNRYISETIEDRHIITMDH